MNDDNGRPINVCEINSLIRGTVSHTAYNVSSVLRVLSELPINDDPPVEDYMHGMRVIHRLLADTLRFTKEHPDVEELAPVVGRGAQS